MDFSGTPLAAVPYNPDGWKHQSIVDEVKDFVAAIVERRPTAIDPLDGYYAVKIVEKAYESVAASGTRMPI
jgi:predicted dehydrogenase